MMKSYSSRICVNRFSICFELSNSDGSGENRPQEKQDMEIGQVRPWNNCFLKGSLSRKHRRRPSPLPIRKRRWIAGRRKSASISNTREPFNANVIAVRPATQLFPSAGRVLAIMITLGGDPGLESKTEVRSPLSASAIFDQVQNLEWWHTP